MSSDMPNHFGLTNAELDLFREAFVAFASDAGLPGEDVFSGLISGKPIYETLGLTEAAIEAIYGLAYQHFSAGHLQKAERLFGVLTLLLPTVRHYWLGLAMVERALDKRHEAEEALKVVQRLSPHWAVLHFHRLEMQVEKKVWVDARASLKAFRLGDKEGVSAYMERQVDRFALALENKA